ncbi:MAG: hypothetical protein IPK83_18695 [Planctomycetes bacterium]|nr:hypothetical protein [Planctomycetota bacterium]
MRLQHGQHPARLRLRQRPLRPGPVAACGFNGYHGYDPYRPIDQLGDPAILKNGPFEYILLQDVLEHVEDPLALLTKLNRHLTR